VEIVAMRAESSITMDEGLEDQTLDDRLRHGPLGPALAQHVVELVLDLPNARRAWRPMAARTPAVSVTVTARAVDVGARPLAMEELFEVANRAVSAFVEHGAFVVVRPGVGPSFLFALPTTDDDGETDEVVIMCRRLDEEQARARAVELAERFRAGIERAPALRDLLIEVRLGEGTIAGAPTRVATLLPAAVWRAA
jgi:hypothetical protein